MNRIYLVTDQDGTMETTMKTSTMPNAQETMLDMQAAMMRGFFDFWFDNQTEIKP